MYLDLDKKTEHFFTGYKRFSKGERHVTRVSREDVLILMLDGVLYFTEDGVESSVGKGEYYIQKSGRLQSALRPSDGAYYVYLHFSGEYCEGGINALPTRGRFDIEKIYLIADRLCRASGTGELPLVSTTKWFCTLFELLLEENRQSGTGLALAEKIHGYLSQNYTKKLGTAEAAEHFSYTPDYVIRVFKRAYGVTPHSYVTACRIEYAKVLLSTTERSVAEIAEACGYNDVTSFYRAFCARVGKSPSEWRG